MLKIKLISVLATCIIIAGCTTGGFLAFMEGATKPQPYVVQPPPPPVQLQPLRLQTPKQTHTNCYSVGDQIHCDSVSQ